MPRSTRTGPKQQRSVETRHALIIGAARVFSRLTYSEARLKDISEESGISEGAIYFHFGNKNDMAHAILDEQQERMTRVLSRSIAGPDSGLRKLMHVCHDLAALISVDPVVQAGTKLASQPITELEEVSHEPYLEWVSIARALIQQGIEDGSVATEVDADSAAEFVNSVFVGEQVLSGLADSWVSLPERIKRMEPYLAAVLSQHELSSAGLRRASGSAGDPPAGNSV